MTIASYVRSSTGQASIDAQRRLISGRVGGGPETVRVQEYSDIGRLLDAARSGGVSVVVVADESRLGRDGKVVAHLKRLGVDVQTAE
jgi:DNA invertase Pin-like site-specific DNA recombinase